MKICGIQIKTALVVGAAKGLSTYELERASGVSHIDDLSRKGTVDLTEKQVDALAKCVGVDADFFTKP